MRDSKTPWFCCVALAIAIAASIAIKPSNANANADDKPSFIKRSTPEAALGVVATGAYTAATTLWVASLLTEARFEHRLVPALALGAVGAWALAAYDQKHPFASGTIANVTSGAAVGLAIGTTWMLYNRAGSSPWSDRTASSLLWAGATVGAGIGALSARGGTTPGRAAFTSAAALWTATATGLLAASLGSANTAQRRGLLGAALSMEAGVMAAGWLGRRSNPTVERVVWASSMAVATALAIGSGFWAASGQPELARARATWGAAAAGLIGAGVVAWVWP